MRSLPQHLTKGLPAVPMGQEQVATPVWSTSQIAPIPQASHGLITAPTTISSKKICYNNYKGCVWWFSK